MRIPALEGIRAIAILLVVLLHYKAIYFGWMGVQFFFVLSGFFMTRILLAAKDRPFLSCLKSFYAHRALRIFPAYFLCLLLLAAAYAFTGKPEAFAIDWRSLAAFTYNFSILAPSFKTQFFYIHFWSLSVEVQFYIAIPWIIYFLDKKKLKILLVALAVVSPVIRWLMAEAMQRNLLSQLHAGAAVHWFPFSHLDAFAFGAAIEVFGLEKVKKPAQILGVTFAVLIAAGALNYFTLIKNLTDIPFIPSLGFPYYFLPGLHPVWSYTLANLLGALMILAALERRGNLFQKILANRFFIEVGKVSYGMYLYNFALLQLWKHLFHFRLYRGELHISFFPFFLALFCLSWVSYVFFESRFLTLKKRIA